MLCVTLDQTLLKVLGCKERSHKSQGPLVRATGKGWVKEHKGQYYDALHVKNGIVKICLVESQGGIAPPTKRIIPEGGCRGCRVCVERCRAVEM